MSRYTGRSLVFIVLRLCFVVAIVYAVRDSTLLIALSHRKGASLVTRFQQPGGKICLRIDDDGWNRWWENDLFSPFFYFSLNVDLNFNSLDVSFFFDAVNFFSFWWFCREDFFVNVYVVVRNVWWWIDRRKWAAVLFNFVNITIFLFCRKRFRIWRIN